ncbi:MAG: hypothetical protein ACRDV9_10875 [Acidimicrobiia bacterium]
MLRALSLPEDPDALLAGHAQALDEAYREVGGRLAAEHTAVSVDDQGRLHVERLKAIPDPPSLIDLRRRVKAMLPRVDLPEVVLEVMAWEPRFVEAFPRRRRHLAPATGPATDQDPRSPLERVGPRM